MRKGQSGGTRLKLWNCFSWNIVVTQDYDMDLLKAFVINGNDALLKCEIPSFVADFVTIDSWIDNERNEYFIGMNNNYGT